MNKRAFGASYKRGTELVAGGCPLDYLDVLPGRWAERKLFRAEQLVGYTESSVFTDGPHQRRYLIGLRLGTDRPSGTIITDWTFEPPWPDSICWDYEPQDIIPKRDLADYKYVLDSRLMGILDDHRMLRRGHPIEGFLCGYGSSPIPESQDRFVSAKITLVDDVGNVVVARINLAVVRPHRAWSRLQPRPARSGTATRTLTDG